METAENLCLGFSCLGKGYFAKISVCGINCSAAYWYSLKV